MILYTKIQEPGEIPDSLFFEEDEDSSILAGTSDTHSKRFSLQKKFLAISTILLIIAAAYAGWFFYNFVEDYGKPQRTNWAYEVTSIDALWDMGLDGQGVTIAIIDTGIYVEHKEFRNMNIVSWLDLINERSEPYDDNGHGTHVAGIIAANAELRGGAPAADFIIVKALDETGSSNDGVGILDSRVAQAIEFSVDQGADIISLSLGGEPSPLALGKASERAVRDAVNVGVLVVAAAGNDGGSGDDGEVASPGNVEGAITVGSVNQYLYLSAFSSQGNNDGVIPGLPDPADREDPNRKPEFVAPGEMILSTYPDGRYAFSSGTSQAVPFVSSVLAQILQARPQYSRDGSEGGDEQAVENLKTVFMETARATSYQETPHDPGYGYGLVDPVAALERL